MTWQTVSNHRCELGESPFWHPHEKLLYWVDIAAKLILRCDPGQVGTTEVWPMTAPYALEPGCIAPASNGGLVIALRDGVYRAPTWQGPITRWVGFDFDTTTTRFNDGKCDPQGRFWAGTVYEVKDGQKKAALYCIDARGGQTPVVQQLIDHVVTANGIAWSPDQKTLYWTDTPSHQIRAWDWNALNNSLSAERVFHAFAPKPAGWVYTGEPVAPPNPKGHPNTSAKTPGHYGGRPDGCAIDVQGNYWVAMYEGGCVLKLSPQGALLASIPTPLLCPTMPCFGGADLQTLYLTSASKGRGAQELADMPLSGRVLSMRVDVPGLPVNFFSES